MNDIASEWIKQSDYDMDTAKYMFNGVDMPIQFLYVTLL
jgi:hypothetical protein